MLIKKSKLPFTSNIKRPKYFVVWEEQSPKRTISSHVRVFEYKENKEAFIQHLTLDPLVTDLYSGEGRPNLTRTVFKVDEVDPLPSPIDPPGDENENNED